MNAEQWLYDTFKDGSEPTMFTLTIPGELAVAVTWNQLLDLREKAAIEEILDSIRHR